MPSTATPRQLKPSEALELAADLRRQRRLGEAEQIYRTLLQSRPEHADTLFGLGALCRQARRFDEAVSLLTHVVALDADNAAAHNELGLALAELNRPEAALAQCRRAVALRPDFIEAYNNLGSMLLLGGRAVEAASQFEAALALKPDSAEILSNLGNALAAAGRHAQALESFRQALKLKPDLAIAHHNMGVALAALDRPEDAVAQFEKVVALQPNNVDGYVRLGNVLVTLQRSEDALAQYKRALGLHQRSAGAQAGVGTALALLNRHEEAVPYLQKAVALAPQVAEFHNNLANSLTALDRCDEAIVHFRQALSLKPSFTAPHANLGNALESLGQMDEALVSYQAAIAADPREPANHHNIGNLLRILGRFEESRHAFEKAIALAPNKAEYYRGLSDSMTFTAADNHLVVAMEDLTGRDTLPDKERAELHFALAKAYDDLGQTEPAVRHLLEANRLTRREVDYDEPESLGQLRRIASVFTSKMMREQDGGNPSTVPIFIIGMPRSGSTLIEQILASHPEVYGAGELPDFSKLAGTICQRDEATMPFAEMMVPIPAGELAQLGAKYLAGIVALAPTAAHITDKMPSNFRLAGLIHLVFPNAKIIHARRNPVDTCLSCFSKLFRRNQPFSYELRELGRYYRAYERLMDHWRRVLPEGTMLEVQYETLVADFEAQSRRIIAHCGLDWDPSCLAFHRTERPVRTASSMQVRQPLYQSAVGRWKAYEPWLGPLLEELGLDFYTSVS